jgi:flotillin
VPDLFNVIGGGPLVGLVIVVILGLLVAYATTRYKVAKPNEALIISGRRGSEVRDERGQVLDGARADRGVKVVVGGGILVFPLLNRVGVLKLTARQIIAQVPDAVTSQGIKVNVQGVATFKIGRDVESIRNAAERFLEAKDEQIDSIVKNVLEGSLRAIVGTLTIEELIMDRQKLLQQVQDSAKGDLATSGLQIDAFTIQSITDESGYVDLLGKQKLAVVERDARMAQATADQEAAVREAEAEQIKINAARDVSLRKAETEMQTQAAQARAAQAGPLAQAEAQQEVVRKQTELADLEAARTQKELLTSTVRPAEAEAEALVRRAEGQKGARIAQAQAEAEQVKLAGGAEAAISVIKGEAQAKVILVNAQAEAEKTKLEGNAEAGITFTKGEAEAKALTLRADAYKQFNEAAVIQTVLSLLPEIVRAAAEPMSNIDSLTVLSSDGATEVVRNATRTVAEAGTTVKGLTGIDIPALISGAIGNAPWAPGGTGPRSGGGGSSGGGTSGGGGRPKRPAGRGPAAGPSATTPAGAASTPAVASASEARAALDRAEEAFAQAGQRIGHHDGGSTAAPSPAATPSTSAPEPPAPPTGAEATAKAAEAVVAAQASALGAEASTMEAAAATNPIVAEARTAAETEARTAATSAGEMTMSEAAQHLASALRAVPGVDRYGALRLADLERSGPGPLRTLWHAAAGELENRYGNVTITEFLDRARGHSSGGGATPTH